MSQLPMQNTPSTTPNWLDRSFLFLNDVLNKSVTIRDSYGRLVTPPNPPDQPVGGSTYSPPVNYVTSTQNYLMLGVIGIVVFFIIKKMRII